MSKLPRRKLRDLNEVEREANIQRTEEAAWTTRDRDRLERKMLGPLWGRKRRKFTGP